MSLASNQAAIETFRGKYYPEIMLSPAELETLSWCMDNPITTPSGELGFDFHFEVKRALNRLSNMQLLREGDYARFVQAQVEPKMTAEQFATFAKKIQIMSQAEYLALRAITLIGSISLSPTAKTAATEKLGTHPADSIEFLDVTVSKCPEMYPAYADLDRSVQFLIRNAFAFGHLRHMLYIEGNQGMFKAAKEACTRITELDARQKTFEFWYLQWFINITGFKVNVAPDVDPHGSMYLHEGNTAALLQLYTLIEHGIHEPDFIPQILSHYLAYRASNLGLGGEEGTRYLITQIAAWSRIYVPNAILKHMSAALSTIPPDILARPDVMIRRAPTYVPALFDNALSLLPGEPELALHLALSIYLTACREYLERSAETDSFTQPPLNLRLAADKLKLTEVINDLRHFPQKKTEIPCCTVTLNDQFEVLIKPKPALSPQTFATLGSELTEPATHDATL
jgi:hypothetical protein